MKSLCSLSTDGVSWWNVLYFCCILVTCVIMTSWFTSWMQRNDNFVPTATHSCFFYIVCLFIAWNCIYSYIFITERPNHVFLLLHSAPFTVNLMSLEKEQRTIKHFLWCMWETMSCYTLEEIYVKNKYQIFVVVIVLSTSLTLLQLHAI